MKAEKTDSLPYTMTRTLPKKGVRKSALKTFKKRQDSGQDNNNEENHWDTFCREPLRRISSFQLDDLANSLRYNPNSDIRICDSANLTSESYNSAEIRSKKSIVIINTGMKDDLKK